MKAIATLAAATVVLDADWRRKRATLDVDAAPAAAGTVAREHRPAQASEGRIDAGILAGGGKRSGRALEGKSTKAPTVAKASKASRDTGKSGKSVIMTTSTTTPEFVCPETGKKVGDECTPNYTYYGDGAVFCSGTYYPASCDGCALYCYEDDTSTLGGKCKKDESCGITCPVTGKSVADECDELDPCGESLYYPDNCYTEDLNCQMYCYPDYSDTSSTGFRCQIDELCRECAPDGEETRECEGTGSLDDGAVAGDRPGGKHPLAQASFTGKRPGGKRPRGNKRSGGRPGALEAKALVDEDELEVTAFEADESMSMSMVG